MSEGQPHAPDPRVLRREDLGADDARRFRTGADCLDLTHTGAEGRYAVFELLHAPEDVGRWLGLLVRTPVAARDEDVAEVRGVRNAIGRVARAIAAGDAPAAADVARVNAAAAGAPMVEELVRPGVAHRPPTTAGRALASLAREAVELFGGPLADGRIRVCGAEDCGLLFVDRSRPGRRRWCSMERCGNRAKTRGYRARGGARGD
ncbi:CGNR zinc finger domain-containing protein [Patulibacter minatonensis]|uniref:CGNR zinc finger domain-containing protein n=1 Tax=Patulibacter minatonensis TaxID=298163 RepID=UPI001B7F96F8|nr:CGNR zinc finger domain-containing protein [Patulibacter minatonensis]